MYVGETEDKVRLRVPVVVNGVILSLVVGVFVVGLYPRPLFKATDSAVHAVFPQTSQTVQNPDSSPLP